MQKTKFQRLNPKQQFVTLLNLLSIEQPDINSELVTEKTLSKMLIKYELRKHLYLNNNIGRDISAEEIVNTAISNVGERYLNYVSEFHNNSSEFLNLWNEFENSLDTKEGYNFMGYIHNEAESLIEDLDTSFTATSSASKLESIVSKVLKRPLAENKETYIGDDSSDKNLDGAIITVKPIRTRTLLGKLFAFTAFRGLAGPKIAGAIHDEYKSRGLYGKLQIHDQNNNGMDLDKLVEHNPEYVTISVPAFRAIPYALATARAVREALPNTKIIMGGKTFGSAAKPSCSLTEKLDADHEKLRKYVLGTGYVDSIGIGRIEDAIPLVLNDLQDGKELKETYRGNKTEKIASPLYSPDTLYKSDQMYLFAVSEGCKIRACKVCSPGNFYKGLTEKPLDQVEADLQALQNGLGNKKMRIMIVDSNPWSPDLNVPKERVEALSKLFKKYDLRHVSFYDVATGKDPELMKILKQGGSKLGLIGIESLNPKSLREMGKPDFVDELELVANNFTDNQIYSHATFIFDPDVDNLKYARKAAARLRDLGFFYASFFNKMPFLGTEEYANVEDRMLDPFEYPEKINFLNQTYRTEKTSFRTSYLMMSDAFKEFYNHKYFIDRIPKIIKWEIEDNKANGKFDLLHTMRGCFLRTLYAFSAKKAHSMFIM